MSHWVCGLCNHHHFDYPTGFDVAALPHGSTLQGLAIMMAYNLGLALADTHRPRQKYVGPGGVATAWLASLKYGNNPFLHLRLYDLQFGAYVTLNVLHEQNIRGYSAAFRSAGLP